MTRHKFLEKARNVHGYKYDYIDLPDKIILSDKIKVQHGDSIFVQTTSKHLKGRCPEKNTPIKTTKDFIELANEIWENKYDYSLVKYTGALNKVKIIFNGFAYEQRASSHLKKIAPESKRNLDIIESEILFFLDNNDIKFLKNYKLDGIEFNFYITSMVTCIEVGDIEDKIKYDYCEENYINLIRIRYGQIDQIQQILWENLKVFIQMRNNKLK